MRPGFIHRLQAVVCAVAGTVFVLGVAGCAYSFTGASVPPHLKTVAIPLVDDQSGFGEPGLREYFTNQRTTLFINDNSLEEADRTHDDSMLEGTIAGVQDAPAVIQPGEQVAKRRITMNARFAFQDM